MSTTQIKHLSDSEQREVAKLIYEMDDDARDEFWD